MLLNDRIPLYRSASSVSSKMILRLLVAAAVFAVAVDGGSYALVSRHSLSIVVWWAILLGAATGALPRARPSKIALLTAGLLTAFALWTLSSIAWATSAEKAVLEFDRVVLYLGLYLLVAFGLTRQDVPRFCDGVAIGISGVAALALASRFFPDLLPAADIPRYLPSAATRLAYPVDYWNGLAFLLSLAVPLLLRAATAPGSTLRRAAALAPLPGLAAALYLTSSRGGIAAALLGALVFVALTDRRWAAAGAVLFAALGSAGSVALLVGLPELVDGPLGSDEAADQGRTAALLVPLVCLATGALYGLACRYLPRPRPSRQLGWGLAGVATVVALAIGVAAHPLESFETFRQPPAERSGEVALQEHLLSAGGSGRWQFWEAAVDQFETRPITGRGAGSYEAWWAQNGSFSYFLRDAHSLYLETLGELGLVGFVLLVGALLSGLAAALRPRAHLAAPAAAFAAFCFAAGIDWMWELTAVALVGVAFLGLLTAAPEPAPWRFPTPARAALGLVALVLISAAAIPLLAQLELRSSQASARRENFAPAREAALRARDLEPWAASPYLQLALVQEEQADLFAARRSIESAIERDREDWRLWIVAARVETKLGDIAAARRSLARAVQLNPRSPLFTRQT